MPELPEQPLSSKPATSRRASPHGYYVIRKGSRYNIVGPQGRVFPKFKSASIAGPRWEELTHTPWPYRSSAYEPGLRLWALGIIDRDRIGKTSPAPRTTRPPEPEGEKRYQPGAQTLPVITPTLLALPAPKINVARQTEMIAALRKDPRLLFSADIRQALQHEVEYHRPYAQWAKKLLKLLDRYEARHRSTAARTSVSQDTVMARHIAWQEQRLRLRQVVVSQ